MCKVKFNTTAYSVMGAGPRESLISVIIPCYTHLHFLPEAIDSVLTQTIPRFEIIVVDDGSPDPVAAVVAQYPGVQYIRQPNRGLSAARNTGVEASRGEYLVFLDADDRLLPEHFAHALRTFELYPDVAMVLGDFRYFGADGLHHRHGCLPAVDVYETLLRGGFPGPPATAMVRRAAFDTLDGFSSDLRSGEDLDLWLRIAQRFSVRCHHELVAEYRRHADQMTKKLDVMLSNVLRVHRSQRPFVACHPRYRPAYRAGLEHHRRALGEPLAWQTLEALRQGERAKALHGMKVLLQHYPAGIAVPLQHRLRKFRNMLVTSPRTDV